MLRLTRILGPSAGQLMCQGSDGSLGHVAAALLELSSVLTEADLDHMCEVFGNNCDVNMGAKGRQPLTLDIQDIWFAGQYDVMLRWLAACLEINFAPLWRMWTKGQKRVAGVKPKSPLT